jgi:hypothetical protein
MNLALAAPALFILWKTERATLRSDILVVEYREMVHRKVLGHSKFTRIQIFELHRTYVDGTGGWVQLSHQLMVLLL